MVSASEFKILICVLIGFVLVNIVLFDENKRQYISRIFLLEQSESGKLIRRETIIEIKKNPPQVRPKQELTTPEKEIKQTSLSEEQKNRILAFYNTIHRSESKVYSQNNEDGVILKLLQFINKTRDGFYVEFGTQQGLECNTRNLRERYGWKGLLMDGQYENLAINLHKEIILHQNILELFEKYKVQNNIDLLSEDTDYADYWIVEKILTKYTPKILVHEVNQQTPELCVTIPKSDQLIYWDGSNFHGGSVCAFWCLAKRFDYTMVYCETKGVNCFWIRNDLLYKFLNIDTSLIQNFLVPNFLYKRPGFTYPSTANKWHEIKC